MNFKSIKILKKIFFFVLIFIIFQFNFLYVAGTKNFFNLIKTNSEIEVTDGILNSKKTGEYILGLYDRNIDRSSNSYQYKLQFKKNDNEFFFQKYITSYGLNVKIYGFLHKFFNLNLNHLNALNSLIYSLIIIFFYEFLKNKFCKKSAFLFSTTLALSPWSIIYANELRYVGWTFFLPILISLFFENLNLKKKLLFVLLCFCLFFSILIKCLITYEYLSTIMLMPLIIFIYFRVKEKVKIKNLLIQSSIISISLLFGFIFSLIIHISSINSDKLESKMVTDRILINLGFVKKLDYSYFCQKNANIGSPLITNKIRSNQEIKDCLLSRHKMSNIDRIDVLKKYFIFRNFLPFLGKYESNIDENTKFQLLKIFNSKNIFNEINKKNNLKILLQSIPLMISVIVFFIFIIINILFVIFNYKNPLVILIIGSFLSSISFFLIAKNWSYIHTHLAFICWIIAFVPFSVLSISNYFIKKKSK